MSSFDRPRRQLRAPLYDVAFEHDACGIGFVADAGGRSRERVVQLALAGLAALGHRGAFAADGASSDGAGVMLPLERALLERLVPEAAARRPGIAQCFLGRDRAGAAAGRAALEAGLAAEGLALRSWRRVPFDAAVLGRAAARERPRFEQAVVERPVGVRSASFEARLIRARRRAEEAARDAGIELSIPSASARTIVYKGLVAGDRLATLYPDLREPIPVRFALFHQRFATNTLPDWRLAQPFRLVAHNGEINTVRGNREQFRGRRGDAAGTTAARALVASGPLLSPDGSDSLSLDEALEALLVTGWELVPALLTLVPEALPLRTVPQPAVAALQRQTAGLLAPWDGPAALVFADGRRVGALLDRNGLRPAAFAVSREGLVAVASEAGAVALEPAETIRRGRLGPGELLLVDLRRGTVLEDGPAKSRSLDHVTLHDAPREAFVDRLPKRAESPGAALGYLAGLDAERIRLHLRTMALEGHEPLWSMGDDTPTPALGRLDRPLTDHLRQAFAQVTNPAIDAERERIVLDLRVELGRRAPLLGGPPRRAATLRLQRPIVADMAALSEAFALPAQGDPRRIRRLDARWPAAQGPPGLALALARLADAAVRASRRGAQLIVLSDRTFSAARLPMPAALAAGAVHAALTEAGLRGRTDLAVEAADVLDVHGLAMTLAAGASVVAPWLAVQVAARLAGSRGAETMTVEAAVESLFEAFEAGLRKTLSRAGISCVAAYVGGALFESLELAPEVSRRCFPAARSWPGRVGFDELAARQLRRAGAAAAVGRSAADAGGEPRLPDPGFARFRADGESHLYAPRVVQAVQALAARGPAGAPGPDPEATLAAYREALARPPAVVRDLLHVRQARVARPLSEVEPASAIVRRFVASAMSVGALSPEAHQAITRGIQLVGGAANTGEGGEDPAWYVPGPAGARLDARIKQVASGRFGVTAAYLARAEQLEIKIAQGSKPGEGGQLPGRKVTPFIAGLRRAQPGQALISPPPHHDIYSIEDLAQLIADLRAVNPAARIGVKLVATRGVGTIAAGVAKAGATYIQISGHSGGTGASPLASIKHVGVPWELGLAETHQVLLHHGLRDRVALRVDGGLQTGRDLLIAALLGAEEFGFGTGALVALGCDMARQCHLDTCPTGIATQREDLRAKFTGTPEQVARFALALAEDLRRELAAVGVGTVGEIVGEARRWLRAEPGAPLDLGPLLGAAAWSADPARRARPAAAATVVAYGPASPLEARLTAALRGQDGVGVAALRLTTAERSFGAALSGAVERREVGRAVRIGCLGAAGQSFGAFAGPGLELHLEGPANDYVAKGLCGGLVVVAPERDLAAGASEQAIAGNTCLYGATDGRLHLVGRAGQRFAVRNSGADAVVEGLGPHGCEYMTGGTVVVLGPVGANFGAGMSGGRAFLLEPGERLPTLIHEGSVVAVPLAGFASRADGAALMATLRRLLAGHASAGSARAADLLAAPDAGLAERFWVVEPRPQPDRNLAAPDPSLTRRPRPASVDRLPLVSDATLSEEAAR